MRDGYAAAPDAGLDRHLIDGYRRWRARRYAQEWHCRPNRARCVQSCRCSVWQGRVSDPGACASHGMRTGRAGSRSWTTRRSSIAMGELFEEIHPDEILLSEFLKPLDITARRLAADMDGRRDASANGSTVFGRSHRIPPFVWVCTSRWSRASGAPRRWAAGAAARPTGAALAVPAQAGAPVPRGGAAA